MIETSYPDVPSAPPPAAVPPVPVQMEAPLFEQHVVLGELLDEPYRETVCRAGKYKTIILRVLTQSGVPP